MTAFDQKQAGPSLASKRDVSLAELAAMPDDELLSFKLVTQNDMNAIKGQLEKASANQRATGEYADPDWWRRARAAQRAVGLRLQEIQTEEGRRRRENARRNAGEAEGEDRRKLAALKSVLKRRYGWDVMIEIMEEAERTAGTEIEGA